MPGKPRVTQTKTPLESKTLWFALITGLAAAINVFTEAVEDAELLSYALLAQAFVAGLLRWFTTKPLD